MAEAKHMPVYGRRASAEPALAATPSSPVPGLVPSGFDQAQDGWIEHDGGECPVPADTPVKVQCRFEPAPDEDQEAWPAGGWHWLHSGFPGRGDIVSYRVVSK